MVSSIRVLQRIPHMSYEFTEFRLSILKAILSGCGGLDLYESNAGNPIAMAGV
ncbi:MAG: hypothetical protein QY319_07595 [Candidatus Kapaibacterium sp.]|nr:hypothetical protein [Candidatus Kapabacteria bacterium]MBZ0194146.1 hypothetical protein [Candidatus Kapabacteria bacterium]MCL4276584.1 hypothetical protein [Ignavibacteria bacterium]QOJ26238.1 MAG: hypothetical protein HRU79_06075 [Ignavibacteria bacterium]WKZ77001.1 MAG: hypothetical protein QY319_07595 [Candidatus Kapabacteria bacterium]